MSLTYGYVLSRERFAHELDIAVTELDDRFAAIADRLCEGLEPE